MAAVQARGDVRGGQECLRLHLVVVLSFFLVFRSPRHSLLISLRCGEIEATSLHFSAAFSRAERSSEKEEDKEARKDDDVEETAQQTYEAETSIARSLRSLPPLSLRLFPPTRDGDFVVLAKIPHPRPG